MARKNSKRQLTDQQILDKTVNDYSPEVIQALAEGVSGADILHGKNGKRLGALIDPDYPRFSEIYAPARDAESMISWVQREMYFKLGWAFGQRHKPFRLKCARNRPPGNKK
jgi:hypothetical protein